MGALDGVPHIDMLNFSDENVCALHTKGLCNHMSVCAIIFNFFTLQGQPLMVLQKDDALWKPQQQTKGECGGATRRGDQVWKSGGVTEKAWGLFTYNHDLWIFLSVKPHKQKRD